MIGSLRFSRTKYRLKLGSLIVGTEILSGGREAGIEGHGGRVVVVIDI